MTSTAPTLPTVDLPVRAVAPPPWHAGVWLVWALAAAAVISLAPSPVYVALVIGIAALAVAAHARPGPYARAFPLLVGVGVFFAVVRTLLTAVTTHGVGDVLFTTPQFTLPQLLGGFTVGGPIELPVVLQSLAEGFAIVGVMAVFGAFNAVVSHSELVQSTPRAFYEVGLVVVVALAFVPSTLTAIADVREADRARTGGQIVRRGRLLRQLVPVLELGMERAVTLAESMDARGFARAGAGPRDQIAGWLGVGSLLALGGAFVALVGESRTVAAILGLAGVIGLGAAVLPRVVGHAAGPLPATPHDRGRLARRAGDDHRARRDGGVLDRGRRQLVLVHEPAALAHLRGPARAGPAASPHPGDAPRAADHPSEGRRRMSAISISGVSFEYPDTERPALHGADLEIDPGELLLVIGSSGSGKSTLLRTVNGLVPHASGGKFAGDVVVFGRSTRTHHPRELADVVGFVAQDPEAQFVVDHVERDIAFVLENLGFSPEAMRRRVEEVLDALGIAHLRDRDPSTLSGGERQRCAIAGALAASPSALVLDEPTSQLDPQGADDVLAALTRLNHDLGTTVVLAEHRLERAAPLADRAVIVADGAVGVPDRPGLTLADYPGAPSVTRLGRVLGWEPPPLTVRDARAFAARQAVELRPPDDAPVITPGATMLSARGLRVELGGREVLHGVDLAVNQGDVLALFGRNGSGKTTLLRALAGLVDPSRGAVDGKERAAYVPQNPNTLLFAPTVRRELESDAPSPRPCARRRGRRPLARHAASHRARVPPSAQPLRRRAPTRRDRGRRRRWRAGAAARRTDARYGRARHDTRSSRRCREHAQAGGAVVLATHDVELSARVRDRAPSSSATAMSSPTVMPVTSSRARCSRRRCCACSRPSSPSKKSRPSRAHGAPAMSVVAASRPPTRARVRPVVVYVLMIVIGAAAFLYPFWLPATALTDQAHNGDAPLVAALVGALVVAAVALEVRRGTMNGATVAILGVLSASAGLLRLIDLPGGGSGIFFLIVLAGAAFGPRFGLLARPVRDGGVGHRHRRDRAVAPVPDARARVDGRRRRAPGPRRPRGSAPRLEVVVLAAYGWVWGFLYGAIMNLWFWPFATAAARSTGVPGSAWPRRCTATGRSTSRRHSAGTPPPRSPTRCSSCITGLALMRTLRRFAHRLDPVVELL